MCFFFARSFNEEMILNHLLIMREEVQSPPFLMNKAGQFTVLHSLIKIEHVVLYYAASVLIIVDVYFPF